MPALPRWDLNTVYPGTDSAAYRQDIEELSAGGNEIVALVNETPRAAAEEPAWLKRFIALYNRFADLFETLYAYAYMRYSSNTEDGPALAEMNRLDALRVPVQRALVEFRNALAGLQTSVAECQTAEPELEEYRFFIEEQLFLRSRQMSPTEEELALELARMGGDPWGRLQEAVSSTLAGTWNDNTGARKTVIELRSLASDPKRSVRKKAYALELKLWETVKTPLAYALNGVKGFSVVLDKKRRYKSSLEYSLTRARTSPAALESLTAVMTDSLPAFRRYFRAKADFLSLPALAFFDLFAPLSEKTPPLSFPEARALVLTQFGAFSGELEAFARRAFDSGWIDAEPRTGKVGGAYCISLPRFKESRVLCNFTPSFGQATTIAHELGHAFHHHVLKDASAIHRDYPMTLAETASIFSENLVYEGAIATFPAARKVDALEHFLQDAAQVIVDILSRYLFETRLFEARPVGEIGADELSAIMLQAQRDTYGDALDQRFLHPYMWAVKGHYYSSDRPFYNYPYAFGLLFGLGLFALYREQGKRFADTYRDVLFKTGRLTCVELTRELGFDIERKAFWESGMALVVSRIDEFCRLAEAEAKRKAAAKTKKALAQKRS